MSFDQHQQFLLNLCRVCSKKALTESKIRKKTPKRTCKNVADEIYIFYGLDSNSNSNSTFIALNLRQKTDSKTLRYLK